MERRTNWGAIRAGKLQTKLNFCFEFWVNVQEGKRCFQMRFNIFCNFRSRFLWDFLKVQQSLTSNESLFHRMERPRNRGALRAGKLQTKFKNFETFRCWKKSMKTLWLSWWFDLTLRYFELKGNIRVKGKEWLGQSRQFKMILWWS